ncbi:MarR family winged helix-turn-helix transcriptional regulator [Nonomuraea sediminis]|uniref:MarR family winged helix-turn-helix transcriptional regulator n=1 Tax=Nonomuraea sediminis TaxID=2835864 RepID=UPI001BDDA250|nr:MarR family transcriptional regulator [Nonomuraea sediminis]
MSQIEQRIGYLVKQVAHAFRRASEPRLRELGLSMAQYAVLRALADVPEAPAAELARRTFVTRQSLRDVLAGLTAAGLASVASEPTTGRALPVRLTDEGRVLLERAERIVLDVDERMIAGVPTGELERLLKACAKNLA